MIKNLCTIEYGCDWIVATQNHKGEGSGSGRGGASQEAPEGLPAGIGLWGDN